jgi:hypothetical protein
MQMADVDNQSQPRGMYSRAFRRADAEAQRAPVPGTSPRTAEPPAPEPPPTPPPVRPPAGASGQERPAPVARRRPPSSARRRPAPRPERAASRPIEPRALLTIASALLLAGLLAPMLMPGGRAGADTAPAIAAPIEVAAMSGVRESPEPGAGSPMAGPETPVAAAERPVPEPERPAPGAETRAPAADARRAVDGGLIVETRPAGARVTVNGIGFGETPLRIPYLPFGTKRIRIIKEGYVSVERSVRVDAATPRPRLNVRLRER